MATILKKNIKGRALNAMINELAMYGEMVMKEAYNTRDFNNQTFNLHDSYGSAVYYEGKMVNGTLKTLGTPQAVVSKEWYGVKIRGRKAVTDYLKNEYKPTSKGLSLVVVAAMPYRDVLELKYKYRVISGANWMMRSLANTFSAKFGIRRKGITITNIEI